MAENVTSDSAGRRSRGIPLALLALILALVALVFALRAMRVANDAKNQAAGLQSDLKKALSIPSSTPSTGAGVGANQTVPPATGNTVPNGNGQ
jgi:hypothetical protein